MKKWITGSPLSFQQYLNTNFKSSETRYSCGSQVVARSWQNKTKLVPFKEHLYNCVDLSNFKKNASTTMEPHRTKRETCFLILVSNLAEPDWISVSCNRKVLHWIICEVSNNMEATFNVERKTFNEDKINYCSPKYIMFDSKCISFKWLSKISL